MNIVFDLFVSTLTQGLIYGLIAYGVYITYKILDFPDLTVDGSFPLGAAVTAVLLTSGADPFVTIPAAMIAGAVAGLATGIIHVKFNIRDLLSGIIVQTALFSINLKIGGSNLIIPREIDTIFTSGPVMALFGDLGLMYRKLIVALVIAVIIKIILDIYFKTKSGLLLRAVGDNSSLVTTLAKDSGNVKIVGLVIANALVAAAGCLVCHEQRAFSSTMGTGQVVFGLAAVIIGSTIFKRFGFVKGTTAAIVGAVIYKACIMIAITLGLDANLLNLVTAIMFLIILVMGNHNRKGKVKHHA